MRPAYGVKVRRKKVFKGPCRVCGKPTQITVSLSRVLSFKENPATDIGKQLENWIEQHPPKAEYFICNDCRKAESRERRRKEGLNEYRK